MRNVTLIARHEWQEIQELLAAEKKKQHDIDLKRIQVEARAPFLDPDPEVSRHSVRVRVRVMVRVRSRDGFLQFPNTPHMSITPHIPVSPPNYLALTAKDWDAAMAFRNKQIEDERDRELAEEWEAEQALLAERERRSGRIQRKEKKVALPLCRSVMMESMHLELSLKNQVKLEKGDMEAMDTNKDGVVDLKEFRTGLEEWESLKASRLAEDESIFRPASEGESESIQVENEEESRSDRVKAVLARLGSNADPYGYPHESQGSKLRREVVSPVKPTLRVNPNPPSPVTKMSTEVSKTHTSVPYILYNPNPDPNSNPNLDLEGGNGACPSTVSSA